VTSDPGFDHPNLARASALIVGLEHYQDASLNLEGAAGLAARFARWLIERGVCAPARIALMTGYGKPTREPAGPTRTVLSHLADQGVELLTDASADHGFKDWVTGPLGPKDTDELFVLFWLGHGRAAGGRDRVCLLAGDATAGRPRHLELTQFLDAVATHAPAADRVAFVDACRNVVSRRLERSFDYWEESIPDRPDSRPAPRKLSVVYAAAHGEATAGWDKKGQTFGEVLLDRLEALPRDTRPQAFFANDDGELHRFLIDFAKGQQATPFWTLYGYRIPEGAATLQPPDERNLTPAEWNHLLDEVSRIDGNQRSHPSWQVLYSAYCSALGLDLEPMPRTGLQNLGDLVRKLMDQPPASGGDLPPLTGNLPPLVVACDYVANQPRERTLSRLNTWCDKWAAARHGQGEELSYARKWRRPLLPDQSYLSILIEDGARLVEQPGVSPPTTERCYRVTAVLWAFDGLFRLPASGRVDEVGAEDIMASVDDLLNEAAHHRHKELMDMVVEFVLPRHLLGWRPEYGSERDLGADYPVVTRDLQRLRGTSAGESSYRAMEKCRIMEVFSAGSNGSHSWADKMDWIDCGDWREPKEIGERAGGRETYGIGLAPPKSRLPASRGRTGMVPGLLKAVDAGAPIVVLVLNNADCGGHESPLTTCAVPPIKSLIMKGINRLPRGLLDLPYLLRDMRSSMRDEASPQIGMIMEERTRLWPGCFSLRSGGASTNVAGPSRQAHAERSDAGQSHAGQSHAGGLAVND
jgi:hypothetical protein